MSGSWGPSPRKTCFSPVLKLHCKTAVCRQAELSRRIVHQALHFPSAARCQFLDMNLT